MKKQLTIRKQFQSLINKLKSKKTNYDQKKVDSRKKVKVEKKILKVGKTVDNRKKVEISFCF